MLMEVPAAAAEVAAAKAAHVTAAKAAAEADHVAEVCAGEMTDADAAHVARSFRRRTGRRRSRPRGQSFRLRNDRHRTG